jgi:hypothetical protein
MVAAASNYQTQLFKSTDGKRILQRAKDLKEHYVGNIAVNPDGELLEPRPLTTFKMAESGAKRQLEVDIDNFIATHWNKPSLLLKPLPHRQIFRLEITPTGTASVMPYLLPILVLVS